MMIPSTPMHMQETLLYRLFHLYFGFFSCGLFDTVKILSGDRDMFRYNTRMTHLIQSNLSNLI